MSIYVNGGGHEERSLVYQLAVSFELVIIAYLLCGSARHCSIGGFKAGIIAKMNSLDGKPTCDKCGGKDGGKGASVSASNKKECTSCEQKYENCNTSGSNGNNSDIDAVAEGISKVDVSNANNTSGSSRIDAVLDILGSLDISNNDDDDKLFKDPPPKEDCPICMLPMPYSSGVAGVKTTYHPCCGKTICEGCVLASAEEVVKGKLKKWCPLCRVPSPGVPSHHSNKETMKRFEKRMKLNDADAFCRLGYTYFTGERGLPKNSKKACELWIKAAELGSLDGHSCVARAYLAGDGVEQHAGKAFNHYKLAAIGGDEKARHNLGLIEAYNRDYDYDRAMKHFMIAARSGNEESLKAVGAGYKQKHVTKDEYAMTLRAHQHSCDEMKSEQRMKATKLSDQLKNSGTV